MNTVLIVLGCVTLAFVGIGAAIKIAYLRRKKECKDWMLDDLITVDEIKLHKEGYRLESGYTHAKLKGWTLEHVYLDCGGGYIHKAEWDLVKANKSAVWRRNYKQCEETMGMKPGFEYEIPEGSTSKRRENKIPLDSKRIGTLTETECEVYLKQAIEEENYELAELIKRRMENFK